MVINGHRRYQGGSDQLFNLSGNLLDSLGRASVQRASMNFVFLSEANLPDLSLVWATGGWCGRFKGAGWSCFPG